MGILLFHGSVWMC